MLILHRLIIFLPFTYKSVSYNSFPFPLAPGAILQMPLLLLRLISLDLIANLEIVPVFEAHSALTALLGFHDILLDVLERLERSYFILASAALHIDRLIIIPS